jgi:hypothetical protein
MGKPKSALGVGGFWLVSRREILNDGHSAASWIPSSGDRPKRLNSIHFNVNVPSRRDVVRSGLIGSPQFSGPADVLL